MSNRHLLEEGSPQRVVKDKKLTKVARTPSPFNTLRSKQRHLIKKNLYALELVLPKLPLEPTEIFILITNSNPIENWSKESLLAKAPPTNLHSTSDRNESRITGSLVITQSRLAETL